MNNLKEKIVVITGGAGFIPSAIIEGLLSCGVKCISVDYDKIKLKNQKLEYPKVDTYKMDVSNKKSWIKLRSYILKKYKTIDGLINGAGINANTDIFKINKTEIENLFEVNFFSAIYGCQIMGEIMCKRKQGSIINITSASSDPPLSKAFIYSASKAALTNFTKNCAREFGPLNVRVNALKPGFFPTEWNRRNFLTKKRIKSILDHTPMYRFGNPKELVGAVKWLISNESTFVTGSEVVVDGGFNCKTI